MSYSNDGQKLRIDIIRPLIFLSKFLNGYNDMRFSGRSGVQFSNWYSSSASQDGTSELCFCQHILDSIVYHMSPFELGTNLVEWDRRCWLVILKKFHLPIPGEWRMGSKLFLGKMIHMKQNSIVPLKLSQCHLRFLTESRVLVVVCIVKKPSQLHQLPDPSLSFCNRSLNLSIIGNS